MVLRSMNLCKPARCLFVTTWTSNDVNLPFWGDDIEYVFWIYHWSLAAIFLLYKKQTARKSFPLSVSYIWLTFQAIQINQNFQSRISIFTNLARVKLIFPWNPRSFSKIFRDEKRCLNRPARGTSGYFLPGSKYFIVHVIFLVLIFV